MIEAAALFVAGYLLTWQALAIVLLLGVFLEHQGSRSLAVFAGLLAMAISYFYFDVPLKVIAIVAAGYLAVGVVWSFWRYNVWVKQGVEYIKMYTVRQVEAGYREERLASLAPNRNLSMITAWIIIWPFSAIENILGDLITALQSLVTRVFKGVYHKIYLSHIQVFDKD